MSIYYGTFSHVEKNLGTLKIFVVDFDGQVAPYNTTDVQPLVGPAVTKLARQLVQAPEPNLGYLFPPPSQFNYDPIQVRQ